MSIIVNARSVLKIVKNTYISIAPAEMLDMVMPRIREELYVAN